MDDDEQEQELSDVDEDTDVDSDEEEEEDEPQLTAEEERQLRHREDTLHQAKLETLYPKIDASDDEEEVCDLLIELTPW